MLITKAPLSKRLSFVLKSSVLEQALHDANISIHTSLNHISGQIFFDAFFWPSHAKGQYERLYVRAGNVPREVAQAARTYVESSIVPELMHWLGGILSLPSDSPVRGVQQVFFRERPARFDLTR